MVRDYGATPVLAAVTGFYEVLVTMSAGVLVAAVLWTVLLPPSSTHIGSGQVRHQIGVMLEEAAKSADRPIDWQRLRQDVTLSDVPGAPLDRTLMQVMAIGLLVPLLLPTLPPIFNRLVHHLSLPFRSQDSVLPKFQWRGLAEGLTATSLGWMCFGASLWSTVRGVLPEPPTWDGDTWGHMTAIMGIAYVSGFAVLVAPSGLGVREFFLMLFLTALLGTTSAGGEASLLLAVLAFRLVWTASEVVMITLVWKLPGPPVLLRKDAEP